MPRYKSVERNGLFIPVVFDEQIQPGTFEFALRHLVVIHSRPADGARRRVCGLSCR